MEWLQGCKDQAIVGCPSWEKITKNIEEDLAKRVKPQLSDISRRQTLIELLGSQFTEKYIPNQPGDPFPTSTKSAKKKERLTQEMKTWLKNETNEILQEKGLKEKDGQFGGDALSFIHESGDIVSKDIQKQLHQGRVPSLKTSTVNRNYHFYQPKGPWCFNQFL